MELAKLTDVAVRQFLPKNKAYRLSDGEAFYLVVTPRCG